MYLYHWKWFIVSIHLFLLTYVLILEISIVNTCAEIIDCFRLSNMFAISNTFVYCTSNVSYSETKLHKTFQQYNTYWILWILSYYHNLSHCNIYSGWNYNIINLIMWLMWVLLIGVYLYNKLLDNTFIEFVNIYFTLISIFYSNMYRLILAVYDFQ